MRLAFLLWALLPLAAGAQTETATSLRLLIEVRDAETGEPLAGAHVAADTLLRVTDVEGRALFSGLAAGEVPVGAAFLGYTPLDTLLTLERSTRLAFLLQPETLGLGQIEVEAERVNTARLARVGFFERGDERSGVFLTSEDLERRGATAFSDVFRGVSGLRLESNYGRAYLTSTRRRDCSPAIFLDGTRARGLEEFLDSIALRDVLAVEIYRGPSEVPLEFSASINGADCGAVLVWTRAR